MIFVVRGKVTNVAQKRFHVEFMLRLKLLKSMGHKLCTTGFSGPNRSTSKPEFNPLYLYVRSWLFDWAYVTLHPLYLDTEEVMEECSRILIPLQHIGLNGLA